MLDQITGLHHVTSLTGDARANNAFFTEVLGLRRVKKTVNFDAPDVYHLYYGDRVGTPGSVMTYFPFPNIVAGRPGTGEVGTTAFAVPAGTLDAWNDRLEARDVQGLEREELFGEGRLHFSGPDGDSFAMVEMPNDERTPWTSGGVEPDMAIRGFHSVSLRLAEGGATADLLSFMGFEERASDGNVTRYAIRQGNGADIVDIEALPETAPAREGGGSVHHVAFAVADDAAQQEAMEKLGAAGYQTTPVIDRDYFHSVYFRSPGGVLFEIATHNPGFDRDEDVAHLGEALKLPERYEALRSRIEAALPAL